MKFRHEKLDVYQKAIEFLALGLIREMPKGYGFLSDQLKRASLSIPLNIAEGNSKFSEKEMARFLQIARGSANECSAILDASIVAGIIDRAKYEKGKSLLYSTVCMLSKMIIK